MPESNAATTEAAELLSLSDFPLLLLNFDCFECWIVNATIVSGRIVVATI